MARAVVKNSGRRDDGESEVYDRVSAVPLQLPLESHNLLVRSLEKLPPFSPIARRLLASISVEENRISLPAIVNLIEHDTLTAGKILGIANSALYSRGQRIYSVQQAILRLGTNRLRNVVLALSVNRVWGSIHTPENFSMSRFNHHALATATAADLISARIAREFTEQAFIAGLFHDIGELLLVNMYPSEYATLLDRVTMDGSDLEYCERTLFGMTHPEASAQATAYWQLPIEVQHAVLFHEQPAKDPTRTEKGAFPLSRIIYAADQYANAYGYSLADTSYPDDVLQETLAPLGVLDEQILADFVQQMTVLRAIA